VCRGFASRVEERRALGIERDRGACTRRAVHTWQALSKHLAAEASIDESAVKQHALDGIDGIPSLTALGPLLCEESLFFVVGKGARTAARPACGLTDRQQGSCGRWIL